MKYDLEKLHQSSGEPLRSYIRRFSETRNTIPNIGDSEAISAFTRGLHHHQELCSKLYRKRPQTIGKLLKVANSYVDFEEADRQFKDDVARASRLDHHPCHDDDRREERRYEDRVRRYDDHECHHNDRPKGSRAAQPCRHRPKNFINNIEQPRAKRNFNAAYEKLLDGPCPIHNDSMHTMRQCYGMAKALRDEEKNGSGARTMS